MELKHIIILLIVCLLLWLGGCAFLNEMKEARIKSYDIIVVQGVEYQTKDIENISRDYINDDQTYIITFNDGTVIYTKNYTLKMEGE